MNKEKQLTIALLKEKLQKLTGKKVSLKEGFVNSEQKVYKVIATDGKGATQWFTILCKESDLKKLKPLIQATEFPQGWTVTFEWFTTPKVYEGLMENRKVNLKEGISSESFTIGLVSEMQKQLPTDYWTVEYEAGEIIVTNDFEETASYRIVGYKSNEGEKRY